MSNNKYEYTYFCENNVKEVWTVMKKNIEEVLDKVAPVREFSFGSTKPGWLSNDLMEMMKDRIRALTKATKTKLEKDRKHARTLRN